MRRSPLLTFLILWGIAPSATAQEGRRPVGSGQIAWLVEGLRASGELSIEGEAVRASDVTLRLYEEGSFAPVWTNPGDLAALLRALSAAFDDGLDPELYHRSALESLVPGARDSVRAAELEVLATEALVRLGHDLRFGRVGHGPSEGPTDGTSPFGGDDSVDDLRTVVASGRIEERLAALRPGHFAYEGLRRGLSELRRIEAAGGWEPIPSGPILQRDSADARIPALRVRLRVTGELRDQGLVRPSGEDAGFDRELEAAVKAFQHRHGLNEDGRVGGRTLEALNTPVGRRIDQVRVNLERARWIAHDVPDTLVAVNVAAARVELVRRDSVVFETRAVVGRDYTQTPVFSALLRYVDLNPTWTVPRGIVQEVLNAIRADPRYLQDRGMRVLDGVGHPIDPATVDFSRYTARSFPYFFRQDPGPSNPLGRLKLMFPNPYTVYMHDTPSRELFAREERLFSHGCIRLEDPLGLAVAVLGDPIRWNRGALEAAIAEGRTRTIQLTRPVMVYVLYWTAQADPAGNLHFYRDVYGRDERVLTALDTR